jgi:hypothetical protein
MMEVQKDYISMHLAAEHVNSTLDLKSMNMRLQSPVCHEHCCIHQPVEQCYCVGS